MAKIELKTPVKKILEINGKEYPLASRTGALEKRIIAEHDKKLGTMTEYEQYKVIISLLLSENAFAELFPNGEDENLDMMAQVAYVAQDELNAEKKAIQRQKIEDDVKDMGLDRMIENMSAFNKQVNQVMSNAAGMKNMKKGKK